MMLSHLEVDTSPIVLDESTTVAEAVRIMKKEGASTVLVGPDKQHVIGIVTEKDILYRVVAENRGPFKTPLKAIMSSPLVTIDGSATAKDAIALMDNNRIRRVLVTKKEEIIGILTIKSIIENNNNNNSKKKSVELPEVELPSTVEIKIICPYCQSIFANKQELSKHIDRLHLGSGLLEGDLRRW